jgi:hypothetical protein
MSSMRVGWAPAQVRGPLQRQAVAVLTRDSEIAAKAVPATCAAIPRWTRATQDARARRWLRPPRGRALGARRYEAHPTVSRREEWPATGDEATRPRAHRVDADLRLTCERGVGQSVGRHEDDLRPQSLPHLRDHGRCQPPQTRSHRLGKLQHNCRRSRLGGTRHRTFLAARLLAPGTTQGPLRAGNGARAPAVVAGHRQCGT